MTGLLQLSLAALWLRVRKALNAYEMRVVERDLELTNREIAEKLAAKRELQKMQINLRLERNNLESRRA
jgi:hypothetical protein